MRIIAGQYRRRKLKPNPGNTTRPITDRAKESLFTYIEGRLPGARVADIFAGTGSLGLESLSRGAVAATFFEKDRQAVSLLRENVAHVGVEDQSLVWPTDILRCSFRPKNAEFAVPWNVIFFDPPYRMVEDLQPGSWMWRCVERLARAETVADHALLVFRTPKRAKFDFPDLWERGEPLQITSMTMHLFTKPAGVTRYRDAGLAEAETSDAVHGDQPAG